VCWEILIRLFDDMSGPILGVGGCVKAFPSTAFCCQKALFRLMFTLGSPRFHILVAVADALKQDWNIYISISAH